MNTSVENLRKLSKAFHDLAKAIDGIATEQSVPVFIGKEDEVKETAEKQEEQKATDLKPVEEAFLETAAESGEPAVEKKTWTREEARDIVSKAIKSGYKKEAKAIVNKYGESVTWIADNAPENINHLCEEFCVLLGE